MAGNWVSVSRVTGGDAHHYITEELRYYIVCVPFFTKFTKVFPNQMLNQKKCIPLLGGELNPVSRAAGGDTHHYTTEELRYYIVCVPFFIKFSKVFSNKILNLTKNSGFISSADIWTPVSRVTGGDTHHYSIEELHG